MLRFAVGGLLDGCWFSASSGAGFWTHLASILTALLFLQQVFSD
jgi:hypothetical protein